MSARSVKFAIVKYREIIADNLHDGGMELGLGISLRCSRADDWVVDANGYGKRFIVRADEMLTAFLELERALYEFAVSLIS